MRVVFVLLIFVWGLLGCSSNGYPTLSVPTDRYPHSGEQIIRESPHFASTTEYVHRESSLWQPVPLVPDIGTKPGPIGLQPYAFTRTTSPSTVVGPIYYSNGKTVPQVVWNSGHSPAPSGDWVFFIQPPGASPAGPARYSLKTRTVEYLDTSMVDPPCNYLIPSDEGNTYIYGAINIAGPNPLQGWTHIVKNGDKIWSSFGSYLFPTLSTDGSTAAWCYDATPNSFGRRDPYVFDISSGSATRLYTSDSNREAQFITLNHNGTIAAFTVAIYGSTGMNDQEVWRWNGVSSSKIDVGDFRWCERTELSNNGKYLVWHANLDPYSHAGYAIMGSFMGNNTGFEITQYDSQIQKIWPDIDDYGNVVFGDGVVRWSHYIPTLASIHNGVAGPIIDPGGICRDFRFAN